MTAASYPVIRCDGSVHCVAEAQGQPGARSHRRSSPQRGLAPAARWPRHLPRLLEGRLPMTQPRSAPMPASLRTGRATPHPARTVRCPHCGAAPGDRCTTRAGRTRIQRLDPCDARLTVWAQHAIAVAVCTTCQVAPGTPCHHDGVQCPVYDARNTEAQEMAA